MFARLAAIVVRFWPMWLVGWLLLLAVSSWAAPELDDVVTSGEFAFLPSDSPSRRGEDLYEQAWGETVPSRVVIVVSCKADGDQLDDQDRRFIDEVLAGALLELAESLGGLATEADDGSVVSSGGRSLIQDVRTFRDRKIGKLLESRDGRASLVIVELTTEFLNRENRETIDAIERLIRNEVGQPAGTIWSADRPVWQQSGLQPGMIQQRLSVATSGEATVGRDMLRASDESAAATEFWTVVLVIVLLVLLYRAPLVALIPMVTVAVAVQIAMSLLQLGALWGVVSLFRGIEVYVTVLCYGAGVDYCFFLIARYREELSAPPLGEGDSALPDSRVPVATALERAVTRVGSTLTASAGTVMCGIGMMVFAQFGKFRQAGVGISFGLAVVLAASLTFTPTLLRLADRWAFWPRRPGGAGAGRSGWLASDDPFRRWLRSNPVQAGWDRLADLLVRYPARIWLVSVLLMAPWAAWGAWHYTSLSYGLLSELPQDNASVRGATEVQKHFPAGNAGPVTLLLKNNSLDFNSIEGREFIERLTSFLEAERDRLKLADVRSVTRPYGFLGGTGLTGSRIERRIRRQRIRQHYVAELAGGEGGGEGDESIEPDAYVTRVDVVFEDDPFSRDSIRQLSDLETSALRHIATDRPERDNESSEAEDYDVGSRTSLLSIGSTASIRDLKEVTDSDQIRIDVLVLAGVYAILVILLRRPGISLYLIIGVFFSYFAALGVTFVVFEYVLGSPEEFGGLDWKVPMFLFTILIAVGEDYNIFLMTRIEEEQAEHGLVGGVVEALKKTGSVIAGCGVIMAGTFSSLLAGSLVGMQQLGFALAFGVVLDTMIVMPILVPAWLILLYEGRLGPLSRLALQRRGGVESSETSGVAAEREPGDGGLSAGR
jgi:RND superfamily putative drug exporter